MFPGFAQIPEVDAEALNRMLADGQCLLIDVREPGEHARERINGATLVPISAFNPGAFPADRDVVVMCHSGARSAQVTMHMQRLGHTRVSNLRGGILGWKRLGFPTTVDASQPMPQVFTR